MSGNYSVISTFSGCGGSSLGYKFAGFKELLAIDFDTNSVEVFKLNFPEVPVWQRDITSVFPQQILDFCGINSGDLDLLDGSPPCQGFSTAGNRNVNDPRNRLFESFVDLVEGLQPKVFVMENVSGMIKGDMKGTYNEISRAFKKTGYNVKTKLMNAMFYHVPQSRQRVFFIGVRSDIGIDPSFPKPDDHIISIKSATADVIPKTFIPLDPTWYTWELWHKMKPGDTGAKYHPKGSAFNLVKVDPLKPCPTINKSFMIGNKSFGALCHWKEPRTLSIEELKRVASFPDNFQFTGKMRNQWARIGNAVMPNMMKAIADNIRENILDVYYSRQKGNV